MILILSKEFLAVLPDGSLEIVDLLVSHLIELGDIIKSYYYIIDVAFELHVLLYILDLLGRSLSYH